MSKLPILIPPFSEQLPIVAKVDGLMALCEQLKTNLKSAQNLNSNSPTACLPKQLPKMR